MKELKRIILELVVLAALGIVVALTANGMNPDGLRLGRDYFLTGKTTDNHSAGPKRPRATQSATASAPVGEIVDEVRKLLEAHALTAITHDEVVKLYQDPWYTQGLYLIIDARDDEHYTAAHIPHAYQLNYYFEDRYAPEVIAAAPGAEKIVVYCNGGSCDDSILTASLLRDKYGIDPSKIFVYAGGFEMWKAKNMPRERGARNSGDMVEDKK